MRKMDKTLPEIPVSIGELMDKWVILQIKALRIKDKAKLDNITIELETLNDIAGPYMLGPDNSRTSQLVSELTEVNKELWDIEDEIRDLEREEIPQKFFEYFNEEGYLHEEDAVKVSRFVELAQLVYITNDKRCAIKRSINELLLSGFLEEKSYKEY
jgi:hypothetical protein